MSQQVQCAQDEKTELEVLLASETFARCPNLTKLIRYICGKHWEGKTEELKEYNLAVEALGRPPDFDPTINPTTRVEVHRLREKLKKYYETEGFNHRVVITLHPGSYIPQFIRREEIIDAPVGSVWAIQDGELGVSHMSEIMSPVRENFVASGPKGSNHPETLQVGARRNFSIWALGLLIAALALGFIAILAVPTLRHVRSSPAIATPPQPSLAPMPATVPNEGPVRIICGYLKNKYIDSGGNVWSGDRCFSGGEAETLPDRFFYRTRDPALFTSGRSGDFSYAIPLRAGAYELRLYFVETKFGPGTIPGGGEGSREFGVVINGQSLLQGFDPYADAAGNSIADIRAFKDAGPASDGYLHLTFEKMFSEPPFINAIEIIPSTRGKLNPIRMVAQDNSFVDGAGKVWEPDRYVIGGRLIHRTNRVQGTSDTGLYAGERWGAFNYAIPVAEGRYAITIYFAETYFGSLGPGGVGSRVFDVYCNGETILRNFDIFKEAGGANRALQRTFRGLRPDPQGKLILTFAPVKNYACINALEVVDESD